MKSAMVGCFCLANALLHPMHDNMSLGATDAETKGVMLAGGVLQDATLARQSAASMRAVFAPKV
jgi:hypothetical protein